MIDTVSREVRSRMMSAIRNRDTKPEMLIRRGLHSMGFRYSLHRTDLPGRPDLVLPKYKAVIWVHGCYWHGHDCGAVKLPTSNESYWHPKIARNRERDARNVEAIERAGWRSLTVWECCLRGKATPTFETLLTEISAWIKRGTGTAELRGDSFSKTL